MFNRCSWLHVTPVQDTDLRPCGMALEPVGSSPPSLPAPIEDSSSFGVTRRITAISLERLLTRRHVFRFMHLREKAHLIRVGKANHNI